MIVQNQITQKLTDALSPVHLEVINESSMHSVPPGSESHFKVVAVSDRFRDQSLVFRHRMINELLADEIAGPIHALSLFPMTPDEWGDTGRIRCGFTFVQGWFETREKLSLVFQLNQLILALTPIRHLPTPIVTDNSPAATWRSSSRGKTPLDHLAEIPPRMTSGGLLNFVSG